MTSQLAQERRLVSSLARAQSMLEHYLFLAPHGGDASDPLSSLPTFPDFKGIVNFIGFIFRNLVVATGGHYEG